jgi:hypothetical protein
VSENFKLDYEVNSGNQHEFCLSLYNLTYGGIDTSTPFTETCERSTAGLITINQNVINQTIEGRATLTTDDGKVLLGSIIVGDNPRIASYLGSLGIFFAVLLMLILVSFGAQLGAAQLIVASLVGAIIITLSGIMHVGLGLLMSIIVLGALYLFGVGSR